MATRIQLPCGHHATAEQILARIPDELLQSERARRNAAKRVAPSGGRNGGRPVEEIECPRGCGHRCGKTAMRAHVQTCEAQDSVG